MTSSTVVGAVVFSDLVGFTEFNGVHGDDVAVRVLDQHRALMDAALTDAAGCRVVKELGDGLLVWAPSADGGMRVACGFLRRVTAARDCEEFVLAVRIGVHHGPVRRRGDDVVGQTVNVAARIVDLAGPGEILASDEVVDACHSDDDLAWEAVGPVSVKGVHHPVWLHRLNAAALVGGRL